MKQFSTRLFIAFLLSSICLGNQAKAQSLFKDIAPGTESSNPEQLTNVNGTMYFVTVLTPNYKRQLWKSDGTAANTVLVKDSIIFSNVNSSVFLRANVNGTLYFTVNSLGISAGTDTYLWKTDGTTTEFIDTLINAAGQYPSNFTVLGNKVFFTMAKNNGRELWVTDGTATGTKEVIDLAPGAYDGVGTEAMIAYNGKLYFQGTTSTNYGNMELYSSDGTDTGTTLVKEIDPSTLNSGGSNPASWIIYNSELYFRAEDGTNSGMWKTDGTTSGTVAVLNPCGFNLPVIFKNEIYFRTGDFALWKSDGTTAGTIMMKDTAGMVIGMNNDYFITTYYKSGKWNYLRSDGTISGTVQVSDSVGASASFSAVNNIMYYSVAVGGGSFTSKLWGTDGTDAGTMSYFEGYLSYPFVFNNTVFFTNYGSGTAYELWSFNPGGSSGIKDISNSLEMLNIFPNPNSGVFTIDISNYSEMFTVEIYNISGEKISEQRTDKLIDLTYAPKGIYFAKIYAGQDQFTSKIVIE